MQRVRAAKQKIRTRDLPRLWLRMTPMLVDSAHTLGTNSRDDTINIIARLERCAYGEHGRRRWKEGVTDRQ
jgi:hypothetical protein